MSIETTDQTTSRSRSGWWIGGGVLWLTVGVAALAILFARKREPDLSVARPSPGELKPIPVSELEASPAGKPDVIVAKPSDAPPVVGWDPKGIADFELTERSGRKVTKADLMGRPWVVSFIFTKCAGPCLSVTHSMTRLQEALKGTNVRLVTLTVDPDRDTPEVLEQFASAFEADAENWLFLTGEKKLIHELSLKSFLMPIQEMQGKDRVPGWEVLHTTNILLVDERGVVQAKFNGAKPEEVTALIERLTGPAVAEIPEAAGLPAEEQP